MKRNEICDLMEMVYELNSRTSPVPSFILQNKVAKILGISTAQLRRMTCVAHGNEEFLPKIK